MIVVEKKSLINNDILTKLDNCLCNMANHIMKGEKPIFEVPTIIDKELKKLNYIIRLEYGRTIFIDQNNFNLKDIHDANDTLTAYSFIKYLEDINTIYFNSSLTIKENFDFISMELNDYSFFITLHICNNEGKDICILLKSVIDQKTINNNLTNIDTIELNKDFL